MADNDHPTTNLLVLTELHKPDGSGPYRVNQRDVPKLLAAGWSHDGDEAGGEDRGPTLPLAGEDVAARRAAFAALTVADLRAHYDAAEEAGLIDPDAPRPSVKDEWVEALAESEYEG